MKKQTLIPLTLIAGALAIGYASHSRVSQKVVADELTTYIPMSADAFTNWTDAAGSFANRDATFWDQQYSFNALDTFFNDY